METLQLERVTTFSPKHMNTACVSVCVSVRSYDTAPLTTIGNCASGSDLYTTELVEAPLHNIRK